MEILYPSIKEEMNEVNKNKLKRLVSSITCKFLKFQGKLAICQNIMHLRKFLEFTIFIIEIIIGLPSGINFHTIKTQITKYCKIDETNMIVPWIPAAKLFPDWS